MRIIKAEYVEGYKVKLFFSDRKRKVVDFGEFILESPYPVFNQYKDLKKFKRFKIDLGNIVWGRNWDLIFPIEQLYKGKIETGKKKLRTKKSHLSIAAEPKARYRNK